MAFLSTPITYVLLRICLALEATGICNGAWVIASIHKNIAGFQRDEVYVGTAEDRAAGKVQPYKSTTGHLTGGAFPAGHELPVPEGWEEPIMVRRAKVLSNIKHLYDLKKMAGTEEERAIYDSSLKQEVEALARINKEHGDTHTKFVRQNSMKEVEMGGEDVAAPVDVAPPVKGIESEDFA